MLDIEYKNKKIYWNIDFARDLTTLVELSNLDLQNIFVQHSGCEYRFKCNYLTIKYLSVFLPLIQILRLYLLYDTMKIYILGAGALGCVFGGVLHQAGQDVTLLCNSRLQADTINDTGLDIQIGKNIQNTNIKAAQVGDNLPIPDLMVILVKSQHTFAALQSVQNCIGQNTTIVSLQNGMGHEEVISQFVPKSQILGGKTYVGGVRLAHNRIIAGYETKQTIFGEFDGQISPRVQHITAIFTEAGLATQISDNILGTMWDKLFINVSTGAISGITGLCYGDLYQIQELENIAIGAVEEAINIAKTMGIETTVPNGKTAWTMASAGLPYEFKPSMLQSLEAGNKTEIDFINGYIVKKGKELGIATPINQTLVACMKGVEKKMIKEN
jgi:2-dehydropantoate 2-reductase